ncbi:MAG TPA: hypothetical protein VK489_03215 [Ferruginibacter sp.]|nr:hypothetical protein [Ferruginibacter sp.]
MRSLFTFLFTLSFAYSCAQHFSYPTLNQTGKNINDFVPAGWVIHATAAGDLNSDKLNDIVLVLQYKDSISFVKADDPQDTVTTQPRMLAIIFKDTVKYYVLAEQSNAFIPNHDNPVMSDPFTGIRIDKGSLQIDINSFYSIGSWTISNRSYKFQYRDKQFVLTGAEHYAIHRASLDYEIYSYNFLTKKRKFTTGNEKKKTRGVSWKPVTIGSLKTFSTFKTPYSWEVEPGVHL